MYRQRHISDFTSKFLLASLLGCAGFILITERCNGLLPKSLILHLVKITAIAHVPEVTQAPQIPCGIVLVLPETPFPQGGPDHPEGGEQPNQNPHPNQNVQEAV